MIEEFEAGKLPEKHSWYAHIDSLKKRTLPSSKEEVKKSIVEAIKKRIPSSHFGVLFSGGIDSTLIAFILKQFTEKFTCYCVGTEESSDLAAARQYAKELNLPLTTRTYTSNEILTFLKKAKTIMNKPDVVNVGVGSVVLAAGERAKKDNITILFSGLGSEEIFGGYQRHARAQDLNAECWNGLHTTWERDLVRDHALGKQLGITLRVPFLDDDVIITAMGIPSEQKISDSERKIILRDIAEDLGMPASIARRQKLAAQYGSGFDRVLDKFAKEHNVLKSVYVKEKL